MNNLEDYLVEYIRFLADPIHWTNNKRRMKGYKPLRQETNKHRLIGRYGFYLKHRVGLFQTVEEEFKKSLQIFKGMEEIMNDIL